MDSDHSKYKVRNLDFNSIPKSSGIYQFYDYKDNILYVGKAKNLRNRVRSYFNLKQVVNNKTRVLVSKISYIKFIIVNSETDALLLENNLIKEYQPKYNIQLKDDKSFPWICIKNERFSRVFYTRQIVDDGSLYYGPYTSMNTVRTILGLIKSLYQLRTCNYNLSEENIAKNKFRVCLEYHIGNCLAPCIGNQNYSDYNDNIENIKQILKGNITHVIKYLKKTMLKYADRFKYENAQLLKEKISILENYKSKSTIVNASIKDIDVFSIIEDDKAAYVNFLKVVDGAVIQSHSVELSKKLDEKLQDLLVYAVIDVRQKVNSSSKEVVIPFKLDITLENIKLTVPVKGDKRKLIDLAERNAKFFMLEKQKRIEISKKADYSAKLLEKVKTDLRLAELPNIIECFDNSNIQGSNPVASCVVFKNGKPLKSAYRHYNIKTVSGPNDFASMEEVVYRRYKRVLNENGDLPGLIVIDGGKGQLSSAIKSLENLKIYGKVKIIGIAKKLEEIYFPEDPIPLYLDKNSETLKLIQHLRDEAHRFGISFHRQKRSNDFISSEFDNLKGIGEKTIEILFKEYKTINKIKFVSLNELSEKIGNSKAKIVYNYFNNGDL